MGRVRNGVFSVKEKIPPPFDGATDQAFVLGYKAGGRAKDWLDGCKPAGERWVSKQKKRLGFLKKRKNLI